MSLPIRYDCPHQKPLWLKVIWAAFLLSFLVLWSAAAQAAPKFPELTGRVVDEAGLLSPEVEADLTLKLKGLEDATSDQMVIVTVKSLQDYPIEDYGYQLGRSWGMGQDGSKANAQGQKLKDNGLILLIAPNDRKVRIEVGYGLEPVITDAYSSLVIRNTLVPAFREGQFEQGIVAATDTLIQQLSIDRGVAIQKAQAAAQASGQTQEVPAWLIIVIILFFLIFGRGWLPFLLLNSVLNSGGGSGWSGGGGGGLGGGFGGGGGGFGGGGSSGGW
jgi:uncharacterized protein